MNERMQELLAQAYKEASVPGPIEDKVTVQEKFAELIVRECMELTKECSTGSGIHDLFADEIIAEHFGVE